MFFRTTSSRELQQYLDLHREIDRAVPDESLAAAPAPQAGSFQMTGLYGLIPGSDASPISIQSRPDQAGH